MRKKSTDLESLLQVAKLKSHQAKLSLFVEERRQSETQAQLNELRDRSGQPSGDFDLGLAAAYDRWPRIRAELMIPLQTMMAQHRARISAATQRAAVASSSEQAIKKSLMLAFAAEKQKADARRHEQELQERLCLKR